MDQPRELERVDRRVAHAGRRIGPAVSRFFRRAVMPSGAMERRRFAPAVDRSAAVAAPRHAGEPLTLVLGAAALASRFLLAAVFISAGLPKLAEPAAFADAVERYRLLPAWAVNAAAMTMPWIEVAAALTLLLVRPMRDAASLTIFGMLLVFTLAAASALARGLQIDCGCFSVNNADRIDGWTIARNIALMAVAAFCFWSAWRQRSGVRARSEL